MVAITYIQPDGSSRTVEAEINRSLMQTAKTHGVDGILGECGGVLSCGTCHVYVAADWVDRLAPPKEDEAAMLKFVASERRPDSRLSCQIRVGPDMDGLTIMAAPFSKTEPAQDRVIRRLARRGTPTPSTGMDGRTAVQEHVLACPDRMREPDADVELPASPAAVPGIRQIRLGTAGQCIRVGCRRIECEPAAGSARRDVNRASCASTSWASRPS